MAREKRKNQAMRVMFVGNRYSSNMDILANPEYRIFKIAASFEKQGAKCSTLLLNYKTSGHYKAHSGKLLSPSVRPGSLWQARKLIAKEIADFKPTHVWMTNGPIIGLFAILFAPSMLKRQVIYEVLDNYKTYYSAWLFPLTLFDRFIRYQSCMNLYVTKELLELDCTITTPKMVFPNGYEPEIFRPLNCAACRAELGLHEDQFYIGYTGSLDVRVNDNLQQLLNQPSEENIKFVIASNSKKPDWLDGHAHVVWLGGKKIHEVPTVINACNVMIIPNRQDDFTQYCFPSKLIEYMACGKPFLITPFNSLNSMVDSQHISSFNMGEFYTHLLAFKGKQTENTAHAQYSWHNLLKSVYRELKCQQTAT